jgi:hypothetical protein
VWALRVVIGGGLLIATANSLVRSGTELGARVAGGAAGAASADPLATTPTFCSGNGRRVPQLRRPLRLPPPRVMRSCECCREASSAEKYRAPTEAISPCSSRSDRGLHPRKRKAGRRDPVHSSGCVVRGDRHRGTVTGGAEQHEEIASSGCCLTGPARVTKSLPRSLRADLICQRKVAQDPGQR